MGNLSHRKADQMPTRWVRPWLNVWSRRISFRNQLETDYSDLLDWYRDTVFEQGIVLWADGERRFEESEEFWVHIGLGLWKIG